MTTEDTSPRPAKQARRKRGHSAAPIDVVIVDEHPVLRAGVRTLLENDTDVSVVAEVDTIDDAVDILRTSAPDVVLLDMDANSADSVDEMRRLRREVPDGALVVLARHGDDEQVYRAVVGGADGHVGDMAAPEELVETIKEAAHGGEPIQRTLAERPAVGRRVLETYAELSQGAPTAAEAGGLSDREVRILELAAEGKTNLQIGREIGVSEHTVKGAISQLLARLRLRHRTEAVVHALRLGWIAMPRQHAEERIVDIDEIRRR